MRGQMKEKEERRKGIDRTQLDLLYFCAQMSAAFQMCRGIDIERIDRWAVRNHFSVFPLETHRIARDTRESQPKQSPSQARKKERRPVREGAGDGIVGENH